MNGLFLAGHERDKGVATTASSLSGNLGELLGAMIATGRVHVAIAEFADHRYVQFWVGADGSVLGEVISNLNIDDLVALSDEDEEALREIRFREPAPGLRPNWWWTAPSAAALPELLAMIDAAICRVLGERPGNEVTMRTWAATAGEPAGSGAVDTGLRVHQVAGLDLDLDIDLEGLDIDDDGLSILYRGSSSRSVAGESRRRTFAVASGQAPLRGSDALDPVPVQRPHATGSALMTRREPLRLTGPRGTIAGRGG
jgi:hypothetical protein